MFDKSMWNDKPSTGRGPIPDGDHPAQIMDTLEKDTRAGTGKYLEVEYRLEDGRTIKGRYTTANPNQTAVRIGAEQYQELCMSCGLGGFVDAGELVGQRVLVHTKQEPNREGQMWAQVKWTNPLTTKAAQAQPPQAATDTKLPW